MIDGEKEIVKHVIQTPKRIMRICIPYSCNIYVTVLNKDPYLKKKKYEKKREKRTEKDIGLVQDVRYPSTL